jgi:carboxyl-terminal processing protease
MKLQTARTIIIGISLVVLGAGFGYQYRDWQAAGGRLDFVPFQPMRLERSQLDFSQFWQVWDTLESTYVDPGEIDQQKLIQGAISGMTAAVGDPYTVYLPPQDNKQSKEDLNGEFDGIGIQLGYKKGTVAVQTPLENHPAIKAGIRAGDLILKITDEAKGIEEETTGMTLNEAVKLIRGKRGTPVTLQFYREDKGTFEETIVRETIVMPSVELTRGDWQDGEFKESNQGKIAWLRVYRFGDNTDNQWDSAISEIAGSRSSISGLVLDLRNNPGGLLESAIDLASEFIPEGLVVKQQGRNDTDVRQVSKRGRLLGMPMTVLINEGSASASEILAGALRDRLGVKLVGQKSFGKGTVQQVVDLSGGSGLHVTVAKWLLPNGDWIHDTGLTPEIEIELPEPATGSTEVVDTQLEAAIKAL